MVYGLRFEVCGSSVANHLDNLLLVTLARALPVVHNLKNCNNNARVNAIMRVHANAIMRV